MLLYASAIFLGAFLLFQVQPLIGKFILPWFGGGPAVWTTCMLFFQVVLLGGYGYAHLLNTRLPRKKQAIIHIALLVGAIATLPIIPSSRWKPSGAEDPTWSILLLLGATVGLTYLVLSATSPLLQAWFSASHPGRSPYRLYALSNAGSLLALVSYPFLVEPGFALKTQGFLWSGAFGLFALICGYAALRIMALNGGAGPAVAAKPSSESGGSNESNGADAALDAPGPRPAPGIGTRLLWVALPACGSLMLLAVTNQMCADIAIVPFLWVLPLTFYLLSFILCFHSAKWYPRAVWWVLLFVVLGGTEVVRWLVRAPVVGSFLLFGKPAAPKGSPVLEWLWRFDTGRGYLCNDLGWSNLRGGEALSLVFGGIPWLLSEGVDVSILGQVFGLAAALFVCCMVCHGELVRLKPDPRHLTSFYLLISVGGALGGVFASLIAPRLFRAYFELHVGLWLCCALAMVAFWADRKPHRDWQTRWWVGLYPPAFVALLMILALALKKDASQTVKDNLSLTRTFYGVLRVREYYADEPQSHYYSLTNGRISHGNQFADPEKRREPTTYYGRKSGVGLAILGLRNGASGPQRVGVVGLGTGTLAAYARKGDYYRFYEINPAVERIAETHFHYLADSRDAEANVAVVLGDARLSMETQQPQHFDVLALDAFTSDAIPIHLLTREAFELYLCRHVKPDGVLAVHISNRYLDLEPVVLALADHFGYKAVIVESRSDKDNLIDPATWVLVTRNQGLLAYEPVRQALAKQEEALAEPGEGDGNEEDARDRARQRRLLSRRVLWTDDYSNLFQVLKR